MLVSLIREFIVVDTGSKSIFCLQSRISQVRRFLWTVTVKKFKTTQKLSLIKTKEQIQKLTDDK